MQGCVTIVAAKTNSINVYELGIGGLLFFKYT
jgi:hypothetical protein